MCIYIFFVGMIEDLILHRQIEVCDCKKKRLIQNDRFGSIQISAFHIPVKSTDLNLILSEWMIDVLSDFEDSWLMRSAPRRKTLFSHLLKEHARQRHTPTLASS